MEELFLTIEQCKHLQELGLDMSDAEFGHYECPTFFNKNGELVEKKKIIRGMREMKKLGIDKNAVPTYTFQEIMNKLPFEICDKKERYELFTDHAHGTVFYYNYASHNESHSEQAESYNILDSAYEMLCWVLKNKK